MNNGTEDAHYLAVLRRLRELAPEVVVVLCQEAPGGCAVADRAGAVGVRLAGCVGDVAAYRLADLALAGGGEVQVALDGCERSNSSSLEAAAALIGARLRLRREPAVGSRPLAEVVEVARPPVSRRHLLRARTGADVGVHHADDDDQARLVVSLRALGVDAAEGASPSWALAASGCVACGVCVKACPREALSLRTEGSTSTLWHHPDRCQGDGSCIRLCPVEALVTSGTLPWSTVLRGQPIELATLRTRACSRCGATIPDAGSTLCRPCELRTKDPFGWEIPSALRDRLPERWRKG